MKYLKKTVYNNEYARRLFIQYLDQNDLTLNSLDKPHLDDQLRGFYASLRKENGTHLSTSSLTTIRYSLSRFLKAEINLDIIKDQAFLRSNEVFTGKQGLLKRQGNGATKHHDVICDEDMKLIANLRADNPEMLQLKVWFTLQLHFARRGAENVHAMKKVDIIFEENRENKIQLSLRD
jgi:hypothetical protein